MGWHSWPLVVTGVIGLCILQRIPGARGHPPPRRPPRPLLAAPRMTRILPTFVLPLAGAILVNAAAAAPQDAFVERALELGVVHHSLAGFDRIGGMVDGVWDYAQTGVGIGDLDGDGDQDLVLAGGLLPNTVLRNDGTTFTDVTHLTDFRRNELDRCVALGDYDDDGDLDVYLGSLRGGHFALEGRSRLYRNEGGFSFTDVTDLAGVSGRGHSLFAQFFDVDRDGLLDLYVGEFHVTQNAFYLNNGDGTFRDAGTDYGVDFPGSAHATSFLDSDGDGELDLFIGNDYLVGAIVGAPANFADVQLSAPPGGSPFVNVGSGSGMDVARGIMGFAWGTPTTTATWTCTRPTSAPTTCSSTTAGPPPAAPGPRPSMPTASSPATAPGPTTRPPRA